MTLPLDADLRSRGFRGEILSREPLAPYTTWRIGGPADILATPSDRDDVPIALAWAAERELPWRVLGNGSNLLVRDGGVRGLVLRLRKVLDHVSVSETTIVAEAGAALPAVANLAAQHGLAGLEFGAGVPGTVGGAVVMNAGWHEFETGAAVAAVEFLEADGILVRYAHDACRFGYRRSTFQGRRGVVLEVEFRLRADDPAVVRERLDGFAAKRKETQPTDLPSCGSVFVKPEADYAGRLIEEAGLKGRRVGGIEVSPKHANFFVNTGHGTAKDVLELVALVELEVHRRFGVKLTREFEVW
jgi:UDP-N-acetylmuramate dehydrogenase